MATQCNYGTQHELDGGNIYFPVGKYATNGLTVFSCRHIYENVGLEKMIETGILCFFNFALRLDCQCAKQTL
jgi:hypothetical protein